MLLSLRYNLGERGRGWRGGVIPWQKALLCSVALGGNNVPLSSPPVAKGVRDTEGGDVKGGEKRRGRDGGGVRPWHTLLPSPPGRPAI